MNSNIEVDRISDMPKNIIDSILTRLSIMEAVRTSILSQSWRYQWHSLSQININCSDFLRVSQAEYVKIIDHILLVHCESVNRFKLNIEIKTCNDIDRWILYVSRNGVKELVINCWDGVLYSLPSCFFSCSDLTHLSLTSCRFKPPVTAFKAFRNLTELCFCHVEFTDEVLENILNSCPLLCRLVLSPVNHCISVKINAPNLVMLGISKFYSYSQFKYTPLLASASFGLQYPVSSDNENCNIIELLGSMPVLQNLVFEDHALQRLAVGDVPARLPLICPIKNLMVSINFEDLQELLAAFCIFRSSPFLQILDITADSNKDFSRISADGFWEGEHDFSFSFSHLQKVSITCFTGIESEFKLIEFLLANAPALEMMYIGFVPYVEDLFEDLLTLVAKLMLLPRVSPKAKVMLDYGV